MEVTGGRKVTTKHIRPQLAREGQDGKPKTGVSGLEKRKRFEQIRTERGGEDGNSDVSTMGGGGVKKTRSKLVPQMGGSAQTVSTYNGEILERKAWKGIHGADGCRAGQTEERKNCRSVSQIWPGGEANEKTHRNGKKEFGTLEERKGPLGIKSGGECGRSGKNESNRLLLEKKKL